MASIEKLFLTPATTGQAPGGTTDNSSKIHNYNHAGELFNTNRFEYAPKYAYLFHVKFDLADTYTGSLDAKSDTLKTIGMLVKSVNLPKFSVDTKTLNAYNRPNIVQSKIKYDPVTITFHDDNADAVLSLWRDYYTYYYRDTDYNGNNDSLAPAYTTEHKYASKRTQTGWGYTLRSGANAQQMLRAIRIYSLHAGKFTQYVLINPIITSFQHGEHRVGENSPMEHTMTIAYESVSYLTGTTTEDSVPGFADQHYDRTQSPIAAGGLAKGTNYYARNRPSGARGILGPGGIVETGSQVYQDILNGNYGAAATKAWKSYNNNKGADFKRILRSEAVGAASGAIFKEVLPNYNPNSNMSVPTASRLAQSGSNYQVNNQGFQNSNTNLAGIPGLGIAAGYIANRNNTAPARGIVSNGGSVAASSASQYPSSPKLSMPLDTAGGSTQYGTVNNSTSGYVPNYMNNPPAGPDSNQGVVE